MDRTVLPAAQSSGQLVYVKMEAADFLASCLVLPELIATVASYLDGNGSDALDSIPFEIDERSSDSIPFEIDEREFAFALFPHTGNVRIVVYCARLLPGRNAANKKCVEHLCLVNGLAHSFGNEPARVVVYACPLLVECGLEWQTFGHNCLDYPSRVIVSKTNNANEYFVDDGIGSASARRKGVRVYRTTRHMDNLRQCDSSQATQCRSHCAVCQDPKSKFLDHFATFDAQMVVDRCMDAMDFKWIAQFCPPRISSGTSH